MKHIQCLSLLVTLLLSTDLWAANIINLGDDFDQFLVATQNLPKDKVENEWERFESKHQSIYDRYVYRKHTPGWEQRLREKRDLFFGQLPVLKDDMKALFASAELIVAEKEAAFRAVFPDLSSDIPVYFLPSLLSFNRGAALDLWMITLNGHNDKLYSRDRAWINFKHSEPCCGDFNFLI